MNKPTDTNQASEDLDIKVNTLMHFYAQAYTTKAQMSYKKEMIDLIRTEKLKLLAEVRERVVGEDGELLEDYAGGYDRAGNTFITTENELRAEMRTILTKLEAEL